MEKRDRWGTRAAFILAAIGSAAGLGNAWRFPYTAYANGGGAFLIPYFVALFTAGIPLMILEYGLGQKTQQGAPGAFKKIKETWEGLGWWALVISFVIMSYYGAVMAWIWDYLAGAFSVAWKSGAADYFYNEVLHLSSGPAELGGFSMPVLIGVVITWLVVYAILRNGVTGVGKVVMITVPLPIILLLILAIRSVTLPGAIEGLTYYLQPDFSALADPQVWLAAYGQVFFTLSLGFGIMIAYASYLPKKSDITNNALITAFANCGVSFLAGFAIFGTLGYMAQAKGVAISEVVGGGVGLAFVTYPEAISLLPGGVTVQAIFGFIFFLILLTLGIDSAFSITEAVIAGFDDKWPGNKRRVVQLVCLAGLVAGLLFATKGGLYWLDIVDHFVNNYGLAVVGLFECIVIGWIYGAQNLREYVNPISEIKIGVWWDIMIKYVTPIMLIWSIGNSMVKEFSKAYEGYPQWALNIGWLVVIGAVVLGFAVFGKMKGSDQQTKEQI